MKILSRITAFLFLILTAVTAHAARPNILWIVVEDMSDHFSCYGETTIKTPQVDRLAAQGVKFDNAFVTAPVCSTARSAMITGIYQTTIGAHHHRSGRGTVKLHLPEGVRTLPEMFKDAGYWVCNGSGTHPGEATGKSANRIGKTDYNFETPEDLYDGNDWAGRKQGQPFFAQLQLSGGKNRAVAERKLLPEDHLVDPADVKLPPYYPDDPVLRRDWADYLNSVLYVDHQVGLIVKRLKDEGIYDDTAIFFLTDHGISHARGKQFCYEEGIKVPLVVKLPASVTLDPDRAAARKASTKGVVRKDLVAHIDIAADSLRVARIALPDRMEARPLFGKREARPFVISARDRCDETVERLRSVRTTRFKYIRNYHPGRPHLQPCAYKDNKEILKRIRELGAAGKLEGPQLLVSAKARPMEEFYDLKNDPWEVKNLAGRPKVAPQLQRHRDILAQWIAESGDKGQEPEPWKAYDSDMEEYLEGIRIKRPERLAEIEGNIAQMKKWAAEGK